ncbi:cobalamin biosynthesis protein [Streptomyces sp. F63]|uniref:cobalamin biosynthesis protein n=1 Tax=Streptomyces sp. F63 TaxID=2824887 RepID=UPI0035B1FEE6
MLAAGVGARAGVTADEVLALLREALETAGIAGAADTAGAGPAEAGPAGAAGRRGPAVAVLATAEAKAGEPGIAGAAARLGVPLVTYPAAELAAVDVPHPSPTVLGATGTPSVAEAAALLAAGPGAVLLVPKSASSRATVAVAGHPAVPEPPGTTSRAPAPCAANRQPLMPAAPAPAPADPHSADPHSTALRPAGRRPAAPRPAGPAPAPPEPGQARTRQKAGLP